MWWTYDRDGKVTQITREDGTEVNYAYDAVNRLTTTTITNAAQGVFGTTLQTFEYDGLGREAESIDNNHGTAGTEVRVTKYYDSLGRQVEETLRIGQSGTLRATSSDWDSLNRSRVVDCRKAPSRWDGMASRPSFAESRSHCREARQTPRQVNQPIWRTVGPYPAD
jgi:YD repeat-containing protein